MKWFWGIGCVALVTLALVLHVPTASAATPSPATTTTSTPGTATTSTPQGFDLVTSPLPIKISTTPGQTVTTELRVRNEGTAAEQIQVGLMKFQANGDTGKPDLYDLTSKDTYGSWVSFSPSNFTAQPNIWVSIKMTIKVPPTADLGYYLAATFSLAADPSVPKTTSLRGSAATLVLLNVNTPNEKRAMNIDEFSTSKGLYEYLPTSFNIKLRNTGNIYIAPVGDIFITKGSKPVSTIVFNQAAGSVLANSNRVFTESWSDGFPLYKERVVNGKAINDKQGQPKMDLTYNFTQLGKFRFGHYTAKLLVVYDDGKEDVPLEAAVTFWVLPWKIMLLGLLILAIIGFGIFALVRTVVSNARGGGRRTGSYRRGRR